MGKDNLKYLNQEFVSDVLELVKKKTFNYFKYMGQFKKFIEDLPSNEKFYVSLPEKKKVLKRMNMFLRFELDLK